MAIIQILSGQPIKPFGAAVAKYVNKEVSVTRNLSIGFSSGIFNRNDATPSWGLGVGVPVGTGGRVVFDSSLDSRGSLRSVTLRCGGPGTVLVGLNSDIETLPSGVFSTTGTFLLTNGTSIVFDNQVITKIWAITTGSIANLWGCGLYDHNAEIITHDV
jgi:hypothetical protein